MSVTHMSPSWTIIHVQTRFYRLYIKYIRVPIGNLVVVGLYDLLDKLGDPPPSNPTKAQGPAWAFPRVLTTQGTLPKVWPTRVGELV